MIYDCTHDNPTPSKKYKNNGKIALPHLVLNSMSNSSIASTWGYDMLVPKQISVVSEKKLYHIFKDFNYEHDFFEDLGEPYSSQTPLKDL